MLPFSGILVITIFTFLINFAHASGTDTFIPTDDVMDLNPAEAASVVNAINPYTSNFQEDPIQVALAVKDQDFLGKPVIIETAKTEIPVATDSRKNTISYTVKNGDTLSSIGWNYGLKIITIKTVNNLLSDTIKPGQVLKLSPGDISPAAIKLAASKLKKVAGATSKTVNRRPGSSVNGYPWGWCTYYVATRRYVPPHWGNASSWLSSARASGYATGSEPAVGAIVVTSESWAGHVAYVTSASGGSITISEMNARGFGIVSSRTLGAHDGRIRGYIY